MSQVDPITLEASGRAYWLGAEWDGPLPLCVAVSTTADGFVTAIVVHRRVCVLTSGVRFGSRLVGEPVEIAGGVAATAADATARPDGQFGLRWHEAGVGIRRIGYAGPELTYAGAGARALVIMVGDDHVILTGEGVTRGTIPAVTAALRRL